MQYLVTFNDDTEPFFTGWFDAESHFNNELGMVVFDLINQTYTNNGTQWEPIPKDDL